MKAKDIDRIARETLYILLNQQINVGEIRGFASIKTRVKE